MSRFPDPGLERLQYTDGALLLQADLATGVHAEARRMGLHVRALHDTWGVATGLKANWIAASRVVVVDAGSAFDCGGGVVSLPSPVDLPVPDVPLGASFATFDLVLSSEGVRWAPTGRGPGSPNLGPGIRVGLEVPLARFTRFSPGLVLGPDYSVRKTARAQARPYIGFGVTAPGELFWSTGSAMLRASIDTSAAGFSATPFYVAQLVDPPALAPGLVGPFVSLAWFAPGSFVIRLAAASTPAQPVAAVLANLSQAARNIRVAWIGVEPQVGCSTGAPGGFV